MKFHLNHKHHRTHTLLRPAWIDDDDGNRVLCAGRPLRWYCVLIYSNNNTRPEDEANQQQAKSLNCELYITAVVVIYSRPSVRPFCWHCYMIPSVWKGRTHTDTPCGGWMTTPEKKRKNKETRKDDETNSFSGNLQRLVPFPLSFLLVLLLLC